jgi:hypothetical protein
MRGNALYDFESGRSKQILIDPTAIHLWALTR